MASSAAAVTFRLRSTAAIAPTCALSDAASRWNIGNRARSPSATPDAVNDTNGGCVRVAHVREEAR